MKTNRRDFIRKLAIAAVGMGVAASCDTSSKEKTTTEKKKTRCNPIGVSTYSFWQFNGPKENAPIEDCIEKAAEMGFDGIEFLLVQMQSEENDYLQKLKRQAFHAGLDLMGFSTHQGFVYPEKEKRQAEVEKTIHQIELAYMLGIPTMRLNTGRWGTIESFDELMANKGIEPILVVENGIRSISTITGLPKFSEK